MSRLSIECASSCINKMIESLFKIVPPPRRPLHSGSSDEWKSVCKVIGFEPPEDLFILNRTYGAGHFAQGDQWLEIHSVFDPRFIHLFKFNQLVFQQEESKNPELYRNIFEIGVYGVGDDLSLGGRLFWKMDDSRTQFRLAITRPQLEFEHSLVDFLKLIFAGSIGIDSSIQFDSPPNFEPKHAG